MKHLKNIHLSTLILFFSFIKTNAQITSHYGAIYNAIGTSNPSWDLVQDMSRPGNDSSANQDLMNTTVPSDTLSDTTFRHEFKAGNATRFVKANNLNYSNTEDLQKVKDAYNAGIPVSTITVSYGDVIIAKLRGQEDYALMLIDWISDDQVSGTGKDNDYISFNYKKNFYNFTIPVSFTADPKEGCVPLTVNFTNTTTPAGLSFKWDFDDGTDYVGYNATHTYNYSGYFEVTLWAYDTNQILVGKANSLILVKSDNNDISVSKDSICPNETISFYYWGQANYAKWDFGDGNYATTSNVQHTYSTAGTYLVSLLLETDCGNKTLTQQITVSNNLVQSPPFINVGNTLVCPNEKIYFSGYGSAQKFHWDFGDSTVSDKLSDYHSYKLSGTYTVTLSATNGCNSSASSQKTIEVKNNLPFTGSVSLDYPDEICPGEEFRVSVYTGYPSPAIQSYFWDFGDGTTSVKTTLYHFYKNPGNYSLKVTLTNFCNRDTTLTETIFANPNIKIDTNNLFLSVYQGKICPNEKVSIQVNGWGNNVFTEYSWNFGDGTPVIVTKSNNTYHSFSLPGIYQITVKVKNYCGNEHTLANSIEVDNNIPFNNNTRLYIPKEVCPGQEFTTYVSSSSEIKSYLWNFGDGKTSTEGYIRHSYSSPGTYTISATLTNLCDNDTTLSGIINVNSALKIDTLNITLEGAEITCPNENVSFYIYSGSSNISEHIWDFGDSSKSFSTQSGNAEHAFTKEGTYTVSVTLKNKCGDTKIIHKNISVVKDLPVTNAEIRNETELACPGDTTMFRAYPSGMTNYLWDFGDGVSITMGRYGKHVYTGTGVYTVTVKIKNGCGLEATASTIIEIKNNVSPLEEYPDLFNPYTEKEKCCPGDSLYIIFPGYLNTFKFDNGAGQVTNGFSGILPLIIYGTYIPFIKTVYSNTGSYIPKATITNSCGLSDTLKRWEINVENGIQNNIFDIDIIPAYTDVNFSGNTDFLNPCRKLLFAATLQAKSVFWDFGDGKTSGQFFPVHAYSDTGNYIVKCIVQNGCGEVDTIKEYITISGNCSTGIVNTEHPDMNILIYPNPVTSSATIIYFLEKPSQVNISLMNLSGTEVSPLHSGQQGSGIHSLIIDTGKNKSLSSGIYFLKFQTASGTVYKKLAVIR